MNNRYIYFEEFNTLTGENEWLVFDNEKGTGTVAWCSTEKKAKSVSIAMNLLDTFKGNLR